MKEHKQRMGRWRTDVVSVCDDDEWWLIFEIMKLSHEATAHIFNMLLCRDYITESSCHLSALVCGKADSFYCELTSPLLKHDCWTNLVMGHFLDHGDLALLTKHLTFSIELFANASASYSRRVLEPLARHSSALWFGELVN